MGRKAPNSQYNVAAPESLPVKIATYQRRRMFEMFIRELRPARTDLILDVGVTSDQTYESSNYLEAWYENKSAITALGIDDASFLEHRYPGVRFIRGNGLNLPFDSRAYDVVHSSAVMEHVGSRGNQLRFLSECARVSSRGFFLTTPNRWFPVEFHTTLPLVHWLPTRWFRAILRLLKMDFFANESNLNLLDASELRKIIKHIPEFDIHVKSVKLGFWKSNLIIIGIRRAGSDGVGA